MRVLIISDTHRRNENYLLARDKAGAIDMLIHCGDVEGSEYLIEQTADSEVHMVAGNNDFFSDLPREEEFTLGSKHAWLTHGHVYHVSMGLEYLAQEAVSRGADVVFFGHTHKPVVERIDNVWCINPGSLTYPRQAGKAPSYAILEILEDGEVDCQIYYL